jgi:hypothetical protein
MGIFADKRIVEPIFKLHGSPAYDGWMKGVSTVKAMPHTIQPPFLVPTNIEDGGTIGAAQHPMLIVHFCT